MKEIVNRKAKFEYQFLQRMEAGIQLVGTEVKSLRNGEANLNDAYCFFVDSELFVKNMFIAEYKHGNNFNHESRRDRKLLLKRPELRKLERKTQEKGYTIIPYRIYFSDRGIAKVEIALVKGKREYDKRHSIKERESKRDLQRIEKFR